MNKRQDKTQLNAFIPTALHKKLKMQAVIEKRPMADILEESLKDYFQNLKKKQKPSEDVV